MSFPSKAHARVSRECSPDRAAMKAYNTAAWGAALAGWLLLALAFYLLELVGIYVFGSPFTTGVWLFGLIIGIILGIGYAWNRARAAACLGAAVMVEAMNE